jgi:hypothetical protein
LLMPEYRFDRTLFKMQTFKEAYQANIFDKTVPNTRRLRQAFYFLSQAYGFSMPDRE